MDGTQQLVAVGGLGLVGVNYWTSKQRTAIAGTVWNGKAPQQARSAFLAIGGELLLVFLLTMAAGQSDSLAYGMLAIVAALWVLWAMQHYGGKQSSAPAGAAVKAA